MNRQREPLPTRVEGLPPLPEVFHRTLDGGLRALGLEVHPHERRALEDHVRLLLVWTQAINLTGIREPEAVAREHILDSLSAVLPFRERRIDAFLDLGSGGGFPGIPLALVLPATRALLVDSVAKKVAFLAATIAALDVTDRVTVAADRAESLAADPRHRGRWPAVIVRAVADLSELVELGFPLLQPGGVLVAWKRGTPAEEIERAHRALVAVDPGAAQGARDPELIRNPIPGLEDHLLVVATKVGRTPRAYPRSPGERKRRPW